MLANAASVRILIKGGKVVNDDCSMEADVYIENGIIQQVGRELMIPGGAKVIDASGKHIELEVDGGVTPETAPLCVSAGATALVAGTAVFKGGPAKYADNIRALKGG